MSTTSQLARFTFAPPTSARHPWRLLKLEFSIHPSREFASEHLQLNWSNKFEFISSGNRFSFSYHSDCPARVSKKVFVSHATLWKAIMGWTGKLLANAALNRNCLSNKFDTFSPGSPHRPLPQQLLDVRFGAKHHFSPLQLELKHSHVLTRLGQMKTHNWIVSGFPSTPSTMKEGKLALQVEWNGRKRKQQKRVRLFFHPEDYRAEQNN